MLKLIRFQFTGSWHEHKWKLYDKHRLVNDNGASIGTRFVLQCTGCGKLKQKDIC